MNRFKTTTFLTSLSLLAAAFAPAIANTEEHRENILGTSFDMAVHGVSDKKAKEAIDAALQEINRLENIFSPTKADSELAALNGGASTVSDDMAAVLKACEEWRVKTAGSLSCRLGEIKAIWKDATRNNSTPNTERLKRLAGASGEATVTLTGNSIETNSLKLDPTSLAKGYILDKALKAAKAQVPDATGIKLDIGGDALYWGNASSGTNWNVGVANPFGAADNANYLTTLSLSSKAVASSGHNTRTYTVDGKDYSQIIDPKTGWPVNEAPAATVVANDAMTADALATALSVMPIKEGLKLINTMTDVEALIIAPDGRQFPTNGWHKLQAKDAETEETLWNNDFTFNIDFAIPEVDEGNYRRPYVGIWVTTPRKKLVRSLMLLGESRRWMEENYVWWRRYGRKFDSVVDGVSRPTRMPGRYNATWDGRDDFGNSIENGDYILHVEMAREHGGHTYKQIAIKIDKNGFKLQQPAEGEIGDLTVVFGKKS
ncbi:DUF2271 domain-containing protein [Kordiimonas laminariae]|uniref:DUF2271 domain-containing protein n=1 Tax=Kordiimonas laminariae TaxID=2917717 RepID=UPI001FF2CE77|nr:DUF2271 domain-containing protein [Kordiimonas laminariae]MCK0069440.1 DUF2271 domain-containing protein [Kordiimonas laminariae]